MINQRSKVPLKLGKIKLWLMGPSMQLSPYVHRSGHSVVDEWRERVETISKAVPGDTRVSSREGQAAAA